MRLVLTLFYSVVLMPFSASALSVEELRHFSQEELRVLVGATAFSQEEWQKTYDALVFLDPETIPISDTILYYRGASAFHLGMQESARNDLRQLLKKHRSSVWRAEALQLFQDEESLQDARKLVKNVHDRRVIDLRLLSLAIQDGNEEKSEKLARRLSLTSASEGELEELMVLLKQVDERFALEIRAWIAAPQQQLLIARGFEGWHHWQDALHLTEKLLQAREKLSPSLIAEILWTDANCLYRLHRYRDAFERLQELEVLPEVEAFQEEVLSLRANIFAKLDRHEEAIELHRQLIKKAGRKRQELLKHHTLIAILLFQRARYEEAIQEWKQALKFAHGRWTKLRLEWWIAWSHVKLGKRKEALRDLAAIQKGAGRWESMRDRAAYWRGRILEELGRHKEAREVFAELVSESSIGYYTLLARKRLHGDIELAPLASSAEKTAWTVELPSIREAEKKSIHFARAIYLHRLGLRKEMSRELKAIDRRTRVDPEALLFLAAKNRIYDLAYRVARDRFGNELRELPSKEEKGLKRFVWEQSYPRAYQHFVGRQVKRVPGLEPSLIYAIMRTESAFRPEVVSRAGAIGLMQLMPTTARRLSQEKGKTLIAANTLFFPEVNVAYGIDYVKKLHGLFPEQHIATIASYNAGEEAFQRWQKWLDQSDVEKMIEEIPYRETRGYVKKVLAAKWIHELLYSD